MAIPSKNYDSDADDEYERSVLTSPILATDDDTSPTDSDPPSTEPTPTTFGHNMDYNMQLSPGSTIVGWSSKQCAEYIKSLGLPQYMEKFLGTCEMMKLAETERDLHGRGVNELLRRRLLFMDFG